jgi:hypothetical protein
LPCRGVSAAAVCRIGSSSPRSRTSPARRTTPSSRTAPAYRSRRGSELPPRPHQPTLWGDRRCNVFFFHSGLAAEERGRGNPLRSAPFSGFTPGSQQNSYGALMSLAKKTISISASSRRPILRPAPARSCEISIRGAAWVRSCTELNRRMDGVAHHRHRVCSACTHVHVMRCGSHPMAGK